MAGPGRGTAARGPAPLPTRPPDASVATFDDLRGAVLPNARWLAAGPDRAPSTATTRELAWVRLLRGGAPAFDALDPGDLAIVSRTALAAGVSNGDGPEVAEGAAAGVGADGVGLVRACVESRAGGIVVIADSGPGHGGIDLDPALAAASTAGLPVLDAGTADAIAIERSAI